MWHCVAIQMIAAQITAGIIVRLPCKSYANFSIEKPGYILQGHVFATFLFQSPYDCQVKCLMDDRCKSINTLDDGNRTCHLNNKTTEDVLGGVHLKKIEGWTFTTTNYSKVQQGENCDANSPCPQGVLCKDTCVCPGYQCFPCPAGFGGLHCNEAKYCKITVKGTGYRGEKNVTKSGLQCQAWDSQYPHSHNTTPANYSRSGLVRNYCRNPDLKRNGPWCYTAKQSTRWEYCDIETCGIGSERYRVSKLTYFWWVHWMGADSSLSCTSKNHVLNMFKYSWNDIDYECCKLEGILFTNEYAATLSKTYTSRYDARLWSGHSINCGLNGFISFVTIVRNTAKGGYRLKYTYHCCKLDPALWQSKISCYTQYTAYTEATNYHHFRQPTVSCSSDYALSYFQLQLHNEGTEWRYEYRCCKIEFN